MWQICRFNFRPYRGVTFPLGSLELYDGGAAGNLAEWRKTWKDDFVVLAALVKWCGLPLYVSQLMSFEYVY